MKILHIYFRYIVLVSGLNFSSLKDNCFAIQLFADWLCGLVGGHQQRNDVSKIVRLIVAGMYYVSKFLYEYYILHLYFIIRKVMVFEIYRKFFKWSFE